MLTLFKGELSYHEFMREMTYRDMLALRDARIEQLLEEREASRREAEEMRRENTRNAILAR